MTCIQVSQEAGKVVWYSHFLKNFPQFVVIHTVKGFSVVNEVEVGVFVIPLLFLWSNGCWQFDLWIRLPFLNSPYTSGSSQFMYGWSLDWSILSIVLRACEMSAIVEQFEHSLALLFLGGLEWKLNFPVLWLLLSFPNLLAYWVQHFNSIIF